MQEFTWILHVQTILVVIFRIEWIHKFGIPLVVFTVRNNSSDDIFWFVLLSLVNIVALISAPDDNIA